MTLSSDLPVREDEKLPCKEAREALTFAIIGYFIFGVIFGAFAISKAIKARKFIEENPRLSGWGKANAALVLGIVVLIFSTLGIAYRVQSFGKTP